jgi:membrane protein implicated in regulation of membrane protease activity
MKFGIAGVVIALILLIVLPFWAVAILVVLAIGIPVTAYAMLDPSQRRRLKENRRRRQLGS